MSKCPQRINRKGIPSGLDTAPFGTECIVKHDRTFTVYLQINSNEEKPKWELVGTFPHETAPSKVQEEIIRVKQLKV